MRQWHDLLEQATKKITSSNSYQFIRKDRKHKVGALSGLVAVVIGLVILLVALLSPQVIRGSGFCLVGDNIVELLHGQKAAGTAQSIQVRNFQDGSKLTKNGNGYSILSADGAFQMADGFPIFTNQGAYLYLYNDRFSLITTDFKIKRTPARIYIGGGSAYNASRQVVEKGPIFLVRLPNGLFVNTQALTVQTTSETVSIPINSVICFNKDYFSYLQPSAKTRQVTRMTTTGGVAVVGVGKKTFAYYNFLYKIGIGKKYSTSALTVTDSLYQYYMGKRYDYTGSKVFYPSDLGLFMLWNGQLSVISSQPLYYDNGSKLLLPSDYIVVQPQFSSMYKVPALAQVFSDTLATYTKWGSRVNTYMHFFLFNGTDTYLFSTGAELNIGGEAITLVPYSSVVMGRDGTVGIYQYKQQYLVKKVTATQRVTATMGNASTLSLSDNTLNFSNGQKMLLFQKPSLLQEDNQKKK